MKKTKAKKEKAVKGAVKMAGLIIPDHISYSQMMLGECLLKYKELRLDPKGRDREMESGPLSAGKFAHEVLYAYTKHCKENQEEADFTELQNIIDRVGKRLKTPLNIIHEVRPSLLEYGEHGIQHEIIEGYEKKFRIEFAPGKFVEGCIDRINSYENEEGKKVLEIIDYKNANYIPAEGEVKKNLQLQIYRWAALSNLYKGYDLVRTGIYSIPFNYCRFDGEARPVTAFGKESDSVERLLESWWERLILAKEYPANRCGACFVYGGCPLMGTCGAWTKADIEKMKKGPLDERVRLVRKMDLERGDILESIKKEFQEGKPNTEVDKEEVGYVERESVRYPVEKFREFAIDRNMVLDGVEISKSEAEKVIKTKCKVKDLTEADLKALDKIKKVDKGASFTY